MTAAAGLIEVLLAQHALIEEQFQVVETSRGAERQAAFDQLTMLLEAHETAEAELVHPLAAAEIDAGPVVDERVDEEEQAKELLAELISTGPGGPDFDEKLQQLRVAVLEHATREERYEFKQLRARQSPQALAELGERFSKRLEELLAPV